jgi:hypothetical protein
MSVAWLLLGSGLKSITLGSEELHVKVPPAGVAVAVRILAE